MWTYALKVALTATLVVAIAEIAKRSAFWAAVLASLPLISLLAFMLLYLETGDTQKIAVLSQGIFWLAIPSLLLFLLLPLLLRSGWGFWSSLGTSALTTAAAYLAMAWAMGRFGLR
jgi:hypothetical protein